MLAAMTEECPHAADRFRAQLAPPDTHGCQRWTGATDRRGYGRWAYAGGQAYVHRLAYQLAYGRVTRRTRIAPCPYTLTCCTPTHLGIVTRW